MSPGYFVGNKVYAVFNKFSLNFDETVINIASKLQWEHPHIEWASLEVEDEGNNN